MDIETPIRMIALHVRDRPTHFLRRARTGALGGLSILRRFPLSSGCAHLYRSTFESRTSTISLLWFVP